MLQRSTANAGAGKREFQSHCQSICQEELLTRCPPVRDLHLLCNVKITGVVSDSFCFPSTGKTSIASKAENIFLRGKGLAMLFKKGPFSQPFKRPLSVGEHSRLEDLEIKSGKRREFNVSDEVSGFRLIGI